MLKKYRLFRVILHDRVFISHFPSSTFPLLLACHTLIATRSHALLAFIIITITVMRFLPSPTITSTTTSPTVLLIIRSTNISQADSYYLPPFNLDVSSCLLIIPRLSLPSTLQTIMITKLSIIIIMMITTSLPSPTVAKTQHQQPPSS